MLFDFINRRLKKLILEKFIMIICFVLVGWFYGRHLIGAGYCSALIQVPDEPMYLFNAAILVDSKWSEAFSYVYAYYGFGYSLLLVPFYVFCDTGIKYIYSALVLNVILVLLIFLLQSAIIVKLISNIDKIFAPIISVVLCLCPFVSAEIYETRPEIFLLFLFELCVYLWIKYLDSRKMLWVILIIFISVYMYATHSRMIIIVAASILSLIVDCLIRKVKVRNVVIYLCLALLFLFIVKITKSYILTNINLVETEEKTVSVANNIDFNYIKNRIIWMFAPSNLPNYCLNILVKINYLICSSIGLALIGFLITIKNIFKVIRKKKWNSDSTIYLFILLSVVFLFAGIWIQGTVPTIIGMYYGRYYEWIIPIMIIVGLKFSKEDKNLGVVTILITQFLCMIALQLPDIINDFEFRIDVNRLALMTGFLKNGYSYEQIVHFLYKISIVGEILLLVFTVKQKKINIVYIILTMLFYQTATANIETVTANNNGWRADIHLVEYINEQIRDDELIFVNTDWRFENWFIRLQVFAKDKSVRVLSEEDFEQINVNFFVTYKNSNYIDNLIADGKYVIVEEGSAFVLVGKSD